MKKISPILIMILSIFLVNTAYGQNNFEELSTFLKNGDINKLSTQFDEKVEVSVLEADSYTKNEAASMLYKFFSDKKTSQYSPIHEGQSSDNSYYQIGELRSTTGSFRTYFYTKNVDGQYLVQELRIERM